MKKSILSIAIITFIAGTISVSYGQETNKQTEKTLETTMTEKNVEHKTQENKVFVLQVDTVADYDKLNKASELRFSENEKSIAALKLNNKNKDVTKKADRTKEIDLLMQKNSDLRKDLVAYKNEGKTEWKAFKKQFNTDMDKLTDDLKNLNDTK